MEREQIRKILLELQFNVNSKGFDYWIQAIHIYTTFNEKITMEELYKELSFEFAVSRNVIERNMRTAMNTAKKNLSIYFGYNGKITNKSILNLFRQN